MARSFRASKGVVAAILVALSGLSTGAGAVPACDAGLCPYTASFVEATCSAAALFVKGPGPAQGFGRSSAWVATGSAQQQDTEESVFYTVGPVLVSAWGLTSSCAVAAGTSGRWAAGNAAVERLVIATGGALLYLTSLEAGRFDSSTQPDSTTCQVAFVVAVTVSAGGCPGPNTGVGGPVTLVLNEQWTTVTNGVELHGTAAVHVSVATPAGTVHVYAGYAATGLKAHI
jgi:hypothetical protein